MSRPSTLFSLLLTCTLGSLAGTGAAQYPYGAGCPGSGGTPKLAYGGAPTIGGAYSIELTNAPAGAPIALLFALAPAAHSLDWLGATGCDLLVPWGSPSVGLVAGPSGGASVPVAVPNLPALINSTAYHQWAVVDPGANALGLTTSNGGRVVVSGPPRILVDRDSLDIRVEPGPGTNHEWLSTVSTNFVNVPQMAASFVTETDGVEIAMTFSAEAYTSVADARLFVRVLLDGVVVAPSDIVFTRGAFRGARSFAFSAVVDRGIHTAEVQWRRDPTGRKSTAYIRGRSLQIRRSPTSRYAGSLTATTPPSGANLSTTQQVWQSIPGAKTTFFCPPNATVTVGFSAEAAVSVAGKSMFVRALIDGVPASPGDVLFTSTPTLHARTMTFGASGLPAGYHTAEIQWVVNAGATAYLGDRTLVVSAFPNTSSRQQRFVAAPSGPPVATNSAVYVAVPNLGALVPLRRGDEISVRVAVEASVDPGSELWLRAKVGNVTSEEVVLSREPKTWGVQSFVFDEKDLCTTTSLVGVQLEWRVQGGGTARLGDRTMTLVIEPRAVPDLAEAPPIGLGNAGVEPAIGSRRLLTILWDPNRPAPDVAPPAAAVADALWGSHGVADYYEVNSGGRFSLRNEGVLGWFPSQKPWQHYWNAHPGCGDPGNDGFTGGHQEKWVEAITAADASIDFASYDTDQDGTLQPNELAILIVIPQGADGGYVRDLDPYCSGAAFTVDGVVVPRIAEWYTSRPEVFSTAAHELGHLILGLSDLYIDGYNSDTEPGSLSLMADNELNTSHIDPMNKLALGWLVPHVVEADGWHAVEDVKLGGEVWVLPRAGACEQELFLLENRQTSNSDPRYDELILSGNSGVVVWHIVLDATQAATAPVCQGQAAWNNKVTGNARRMLRVVRPSVDFTTNGAWDASDYGLTSFGHVCPGIGTPGVNVLRWADGTPSGCQLLGWPAFAPSMSVFVDVP